MKPSLRLQLLTQLTRLLMRAATLLLGEQRATWAQAMRAEMQAQMMAIGHEREALAFAWGCFCAAVGHAMKHTFAGLTPVHRAGVWACSAAVLVGCAFMLSAGAPAHYAGMNLLSLAFAVASFRLLPLPRLQEDELLRARLSFAMGALLLVASLGSAPMGLAAWLRIGPVHLNLLWLALPALLVASDVRQLPSARPWALGGLLLACGALALSGDAVLAGLVSAVLGLRAWNRPSLPNFPSLPLALLAIANGATSLHFSQRWQAPEAMRFVDRVLQTGFEQGLTTGLVLALLQLLLLWPALHHRRAHQHGLVWGLVVALSLPGRLPSPLVGFGGSFIVAYLLSLAMVRGNALQSPHAGVSRAAALPQRDPPAWPRSGLT